MLEKVENCGITCGKNVRIECLVVSMFLFDFVSRNLGDYTVISRKRACACLYQQVFFHDVVRLYLLRL
jgi:hypothetical protein